MNVIIRSQSKVKEVMNRDVGLCVCCGFKAHEVHHITPLIFGGEDTTDNMVAICSDCHRYAPNTKDAFADYLRKGGHRLPYIYGKAILDYWKSEEMKKLYSFNEFMVFVDTVINSMRNIDINNAIEEHNWKNRSLQNNNNVKQKASK